eukprot:SAG11_NODE_53189_length_104_cov_60.000000_1_plen_29_part_01
MDDNYNTVEWYLNGTRGVTKKTNFIQVLC